MGEDPGHPRKGQGHRFVVRGSLTLYIWGWYTVWLTGSQLQSIKVSVPCIRLWCALMDPAVGSTPHSWHDIRLWCLTRYKTPTPVYFSAMASSEILARNEPVWHVILHDLVTLYTRPYLMKRPTRSLIVCCSQSKSHDTTKP